MRMPEEPSELRAHDLQRGLDVNAMLTCSFPRVVVVLYFAVSNDEEVEIRHLRRLRVARIEPAEKRLEAEVVA